MEIENEQYAESFFSACQVNDYDAAKEIIYLQLKDAIGKRKLELRLLNCINILATRYCLERQYDLAEALYVKGLAVAENILGANHASVIDGLEKLAVVVRERHGSGAANAIAFRAQSLSLGRVV